MKSFLDMEVLARGGKVEEDIPSYPIAPAYMQPVPQPMVVQQIPQMELKGQETYETPEEYFFCEKEREYEVHVIIANRLQDNKMKSNRIVYDKKTKNRDICLAYYLIGSVTKVTTEGLEQDSVQFAVQSIYYDKAQRKEQIFEFLIDEETLNGDNLVQVIRKAFGSKHTPFPPKKGSYFNDFLSKYIMDKFHKSPIERHIFPCPNLNDISDLSDPEKKSIVKLFYKMYHNTSCEVKLLLSAGFGAVCCNELNFLECKITPNITKTIVVYGCKNNEQQKLVTALSSTALDKIRLMKLSDIRVTAKQDELKEIFFKHQYQPLIFLDDTISDYAKKQNIAKIQRITEYVSNGIQREEKPDIPCTAVVLTNRKLSEFKPFSDDCIFINAENISEQDNDADIIQTIVSDFLSLLYENTKYYFSAESKHIYHILDNVFGAEISQQKIIGLCEIYDFMAQSLFDNYGIGNQEEDWILNRCLKKRRKSIPEFLNENRLLLSSEAIADEFIAKLNHLIQAEDLQVRLYDKSLVAVNQALLYEHQGEAVLLFSSEYFEELFTSFVVDNKSFREILSERGYMAVNYLDRCGFRMPIDDRKLYVAVKINALDEQSIKMLPDLHPVHMPDLNDGVDRIFLANDEYGNPRYWSVGKMENRSVLVQGDSRTGKTYFTTTRLIMGLHRLGYRVIIFDSVLSSYSNRELERCNFNDTSIAKKFCHGNAENADEIMHEFEKSSDKVYIVSSETNPLEKQKLCDLLFNYQKNEFKKNPENTLPLFIVFEEAGDSTLYNEPELKRIYNQGSKMNLSTITILQTFSGEGSRNFRKMVCQASLKVSFRCGTDGIKYFTEALPSEIKATAINRLPKLNMGEAVICGDFENSDGMLSTDGFISRKD